MKRWPTKPLGELVLPTEQRDPRERPSEEFFYVDIASVDNDVKAILPPKRVMGTDAPSRAKKIIRRGDVVVATVRPNLNAVALVPDWLDNQICSTGFTVLRPGAQLMGGYLFAFVRSPAFINHLVARTTGANYPAVTDGDVKDAHIPLPPLAEQERIVKLLDEADGLRKLRAQADRRTANLVPALFHEMFGDPTRNEKSWPLKPLGELATDLQPGFACRPSPGLGIPQLRPLNLTPNGALMLEGTKSVCYPAAQAERYLLRDGDILFNNTNSPDLVGKSGIFRWSGRFAFSNHITRIKVRDVALMPEFLHQLLQGLWNQGVFKKRCTQWVNQAAINVDALSSLEILVPPLSLQKEFSQRVIEIRKLEAAQAASRTRLDALFQSMLHRAFNGEL